MLPALAQEKSGAHLPPTPNTTSSKLPEDLSKRLGLLFAYQAGSGWSSLSNLTPAAYGGAID
jgi:hypothetical protein